MEPYVVVLPMLYDEIILAILGFLVIFVAVRVVIRAWDLVGI